MQLIRSIRDSILALLREESGQDTFEYLLIIGGISVAIILAVVVVSPGLMSSVLTGVCDAIATIPGMGGVSC